MKFNCVFNNKDSVVIEKVSAEKWLIKNIWSKPQRRGDRVIETIATNSFVKELVEFINNYIADIPTADLSCSDTLRISTEQDEFGQIHIAFISNLKEQHVSNYFDIESCLTIKGFLEKEISNG